jgi:hypothetical protein
MSDQTSQNASDEIDLGVVFENTAQNNFLKVKLKI